MRKPNRASPAVQVKATPANNRFKDVLAAEKAEPQSPVFDLPPSSAQVVPASTLPRKFADRLPYPGLPPADRVHATPVRPTSSTPATTSFRPIQETPGPGPDQNILPSSPIMARKAAPPPPPPFALAQQQPRRTSQYLPVPTAGRFDIPSSPGLGMLFETPIAPRAMKERLNVVDDTPIKSRLPLGVAGDGGNRNRSGSGMGMGMGAVRVKVKGMGVVRVRETRSDDSGRGGNENGNGNGNGSGNGVSIYQQLGWDTTDLDDIDDLL
jgi:DNA replication regulator SLD3